MAFGVELPQKALDQEDWVQLVLTLSLPICAYCGIILQISLREREYFMVNVWNAPCPLVPTSLHANVRTSTNCLDKNAMELQLVPRLNSVKENF